MANKGRIRSSLTETNKTVMDPIRAIPHTERFQEAINRCNIAMLSLKQTVNEILGQDNQPEEINDKSFYSTHDVLRYAPGKIDGMAEFINQTVEVLRDRLI